MGCLPAQALRPVLGEMGSAGLILALLTWGGEWPVRTGGLCMAGPSGPLAMGWPRELGFGR